MYAFVMLVMVSKSCISLGIPFSLHAARHVEVQRFRTVSFERLCFYKTAISYIVIKLLVLKETQIGCVQATYLRSRSSRTCVIWVGMNHVKARLIVAQDG